MREVPHDQADLLGDHFTRRLRRGVDGNFDWAAPDGELHRFVNDLERPVGTYLYGRRMYEVMVAWETMNCADQPSLIQDFAEIWQEAEKIVYSKTMATVSSAMTRLASGTSMRKLSGR